MDSDVAKDIFGEIWEDILSDVEKKKIRLFKRIAKIRYAEKYNYSSITDSLDKLSEKLNSTGDSDLVIFNTYIKLTNVLLKYYSTAVGLTKSQSSIDRIFMKMKHELTVKKLDIEQWEIISSIFGIIHCKAFDVVTDIIRQTEMDVYGQCHIGESFPISKDLLSINLVRECSFGCELDGSPIPFDYPYSESICTLCNRRWKKRKLSSFLILRKKKIIALMMSNNILIDVAQEIKAEEHYRRNVNRSNCLYGLLNKHRDLVIEGIKYQYQIMNVDDFIKSIEGEKFMYSIYLEYLSIFLDEYNINSDIDLAASLLLFNELKNDLY